MKVNILLVEGKRADRPSFFNGLIKKDFAVESVPSGTAAITHLDNTQPHLILVDLASMRTNGRRICTSLRKRASAIPILVVVDQNYDQNEKPDANIILTEPFTIQKLVNRIRTLLPLDDSEHMIVGPWQLDVDQRRVRFEGRQVRLTPRLVILLKALLDHPGEVIERKELFSRVWDTHYTDDTRTLDVHISWLRHALEEDPRHPKYVKTVRGVGYRLDIESGKKPLPRPGKSPRKENISQ
jgi:DNA-binding response OmpR family regulator